MHTHSPILRLLQKDINLPGHRILSKAVRSFSKTEKVFFFGFFVIIIGTTLVFLFRINNAFLVTVPLHEGSITEGIVGTTQPRINPVTANPFSASGADNDLVMLVYSGLMRATPDGDFIPDLAEKYTISDDGRTYTFTLKSGLVWQDGEPITSADVAFTIQKVQDPEINSSYFANWSGVTVATPDDQTIVFTLATTYSPFIQNTTLGILPKHLWSAVNAESFGANSLNIEPIGSGPYKIETKKVNGNDTVEYYTLESFDKYALGKPFIKNIRLQFYADEQAMIDAYRKGEITNMHSISPEAAQQLEKQGYPVKRAGLPRIFGAFFNQNKAAVFTKKEVRQALDMSIDRNEIVNKVLFGYATGIYGPLPPGSLGYTESTTSPISTDQMIENGKALLSQAGWVQDEQGILTKKVQKDTLRLSFTISTTKEAPELVAIANILKSRWEKMGADVKIKVFDTKTDLENSAIRPRDYDILLFGEIIGRDSDPYAFWHSSQRADPGLNIASYTNSAVDSALQKARTATDTPTRIEQYRVFQKTIHDDVPAVFLYSPQLIYLTRDNVKNMNLKYVNTPSERFLDIYSWFVKTERVWKIFVN